MENDNVGRLDGVGVDGDVVQPSPHATRKPGLAQEAFGLALVGGRKLQIDAALGAPLQQLDLELPDAAPHLEHRVALNSGLLEEPNHPARSLVETPPAVAPSHPAGNARPEGPASALPAAAASSTPRSTARLASRR